MHSTPDNPKPSTKSSIIHSFHFSNAGSPSLNSLHQKRSNPKETKCALFWFESVFNFVFSTKYYFDFLNEGRKWLSKNCKKQFFWINFDFFSFCQTLNNPTIP